MDGLTLQPTRVPQRYLAKLPIGGLVAELTLDTASVANLSKAQLRDFQCPAAADPKSTAQPAKASLDGRTVPGKVAKDAVKQLTQQPRR